MPLTKEQLLIPRVMCVGTKEGFEIWPGSSMASDKFVTGGILTLDTKTIIGTCFKDWTGREWYMAKLNQFPHLFRPMPWWEGRKPEDMPEYVTVNLLGSLQWMANEIKTGAVYKLDADFKYNYYKGHYLGIQYNNGGGTLGEYLLPATEQEYLDYQKQKEG